MESRSVYCWGNTDDGQLGLGGIEEVQIFVPKELPSMVGKKVREIAVGVNHTLFVMSDGSLFSCGNNDYSQLGHDKPRKKPNCITVLETVVITHASCGFGHSVALTNMGSVYTWGSNDLGQLGLTTTEPTALPKLLKFFETRPSITHLSCGYNHTLALTNTSEVYSWGCNEFGQLGVGHSAPNQIDPRLVQQLTGLPIRQLCAGGNHSFALTLSGTLLGWGLNKNGQLGLGDQENRPLPTACKQLKSQNVKYVSCGENHTAVLTQDGGVFTFGAGTYGQLGHGMTQSVFSPRKVFELMGSEVTMIACGRNHTLAYVASTHRLYSCGLASNGQLGLATRSNQISPLPLRSFPFFNSSNNDPLNVVTIYSNGDQCFATMLYSESEQVISSDFRNRPPLITLLTDEVVAKVKGCVSLKDPLARTLESVFSSLACINGSFLTDSESNSLCHEARSEIDPAKVKYAFDSIKSSNSKSLIDLVEGLLERLIVDLAKFKFLESESMRIFAVLPLTYIFESPKTHRQTFICPLACYILRLNKNLSDQLNRWWTDFGKEFQLNFINCFKLIVTDILEEKKNFPSEDLISVLRRIRAASQLNINNDDQHVLYTCLEMLKKLFYMNEANKQVVDISSFYIPNLHNITSLDNDYVFWWFHQQKNQLPSNLDAKSSPISFQGELQPYCLYPFVFDGPSKTYLLQVDAYFQMQGAVVNAQRQNLNSFLSGNLFTSGDISPCLVLHVSRNNIVRDTISQLSKFNHVDFKKPMKVIFLGEEALDAGGVKKEFFMLLLKDILDPKYGMFEYYEESNLIWFNATTFEASDMYQLIGVVCGLAIYNSNIISMNLPLVLFKKLLNKPPDLDDLKELKPTIGRSIQQLLDYEEEDVAQVFNLTFEINREMYGCIETVELVDGGSEKVVEKENKSEFARLYVDYIFNKSITEQFNAFSTGFHKVCGGKILELFQPKELQSMVVGNENYDWKELENITQYKDIAKNDITIKLFWEVFYELPIEDKKKFLLFLTGCDRIPILGMSSVKLIIQGVNGPTDQLPVAHTCFNILDLPRYQEKELLRRKLLLAIEHTQGFGLV